MTTDIDKSKMPVLSDEEQAQAARLRQAMAQPYNPDELNVGSAGSMNLAEGILSDIEKEAADFNTLNDIKPGAAEHYFEIEIHTRPAYGLVLGRKRLNTEKINEFKLRIAHLPEIEQERALKRMNRPILGLFQFTALTKYLISGSYADDPFADKILLQIETALIKFEDSLDQSLATVERMVENLKKNGISANKMRSKHAIKIPMNSNSPYAMRLAYLIVKFDQLARLYLPLRQMQIISFEQWELAFEESRSRFRKLVNIPLQYRHTGVTRDALLNYDEEAPNELVKKALRKHGVIADEILTKQIKPAILYAADKQMGILNPEAMKGVLAYGE